MLTNEQIMYQAELHFENLSSRVFIGRKEYIVVVPEKMDDQGTIRWHEVVYRRGDLNDDFTVVPYERDNK